MRRGQGLPVGESREVRDWFKKIQMIWQKWSDMEGNNPPLVRCTAGPRRDFDINIDGMAHYGLLPDLLQDLCNFGLTAEDLKPLFRGAEDYVQMWERCGASAAALNEGGSEGAAA